MARYIDADLLDPVEFDNCTPYQASLIIDDVPTADVVPKSDVESIFAELEREIEEALKNNYNIRPKFENSDELWHNVNGKINALRGIEYFITELKKKYLEVKDET